MADDVQEWVSPEGDRIAVVDLQTGDVWMMKRLGPADAAGTVAMLPRWSRVISPAPASQHRGRRRRSAE